MGSRWRSVELFWQRPVVVVVAVVVAAGVALGAYSMTQARSADPSVADQQQAKDEASAVASSLRSSMNSVDAAARLRQIAFIGDSFVVGLGASQPTKRWTSVLSRDEKWTEVNLAISATGYVASGTKKDSPYRAEVGRIVASGAGTIVVFGGRNDIESYQKDPAHAVAIINETFTDMRKARPKAKIIAISPIWGDTKLPRQIPLIGAAVRSAVTAVGGRYVEIGQPLSGRPDLMATDRIHPNDAGHAALAAAIFKQLPNGA